MYQAVVVPRILGGVLKFQKLKDFSTIATEKNVKHVARTYQFDEIKEN